MAFAVIVSRVAEAWLAAPAALTGAADLEDVADRVREVAAGADVGVLFVEADDAYLAILRIDDGENAGEPLVSDKPAERSEVRVFGSDVTFAGESRLGALLLGGFEEAAATPAEPDPRSTVDVGIVASEPVGDAELLADLGMPGGRLLELCGRDHLVPSDITSEICLALGCADEVDQVRVAHLREP